MIEKIGGVTLDYEYYKGTDLYSDGDEIEEYILKVCRENQDYQRVLMQDNRFPILYHLSDERQNIVLPMDISPMDEVLEIGAGTGTATGALAERGGYVTCIELSKRRSTINAYHNAKYDNISIFVGNFEDIELPKEKYDVVTMIAVFEYAQFYIHSEHPYEDFLNKAAAYLKPKGKLYIAIENKLGLKYFGGCIEDHLYKPFVGLEGYKVTDPARTFTRSQLKRLCEENGFISTYFYYPFPDFKFPSVIYSDDCLPSKDTRFPWIVNYDAERMLLFDENCVINSIDGGDEMRMLANSFLAEAKKR